MNVYTAVNSLALRKYSCNIQLIFSSPFQGLISCAFPVKFPSGDCHQTSITGDYSIPVQVMAWCRQTTSHSLNRCWPSFMTPYVAFMPQCVIYFDYIKHKSNLQKCVISIEMYILCALFRGRSDKYSISHKMWKRFCCILIFVNSTDHY